MIDKAAIAVKAGDGGAGAVDFGRRRGKTFGPPMGGDGGKGGDVYFIVSKHMATLKSFQHKKRFVASDGGRGLSNQKSGAAGNDLAIEVPRGTIVFDQRTGQVLVDMADTSEKVLIAQGGLGGRGNMHLRKAASHAKHQLAWETWSTAQPGLPGETKELLLELKLIADIGLIGLPNAGKSTLLAVLTNAKPKIADYPFTTLEPNLGVLEIEEQTFVIADIPGLIEGAHAGKGLGKDFLRHIERTKALVHVTQSLQDYRLVRIELAEHSAKLLEKPEIIVLSKIDTLSQLDLDKAKEQFEAANLEVLPVSAVTHAGLDVLRQKLQTILA